MSPEKMQFLMDFAGKDKPNNQKEIMPFLLNNLKIAKQKNIDFTKPEIQIICDLLCSNLSPEEQKRAKKIMALMSSMG